MQFVSTRGSAPAVSLSDAIRAGAAPDGGLYMPEAVPAVDWAALDPALPLADFAARLLVPFFAGDRLEGELEAICREAFDFPVPLATPDPRKPGLRALELFHGPTGAFKDFGARFLMACFDRLGDPTDPLTVLAATSGDTGGAVGCAAEGRAAVRALILYPKGRVSPFQELQLTCWGPPVRALEVEGDFDDCQRLAKAAFADRRLVEAHRLTSANSINIGRLLPQAAYLAHAASRLSAETGETPGLIVPTGNLGHGFAALYARALGAPLGPILLVTNANRTLSEWHRSGAYEPRPAVATMANAMDVGAPSNFERLVALPPELRDVRVELVDDDAIRVRIRAEYEASGYVWCPHSATAAEAYTRLPEAERKGRPWIAAATAHPFKFAESIQPLIGTTIEPPPALRAILGREAHKVTIEPRLDALVEMLESEPLAA
ncbi:MAG TPA: threonine synthase [Allosphingosinicella sp.]|jgi:threonine synthase|nr:threonine synthase [Allosphingosinicella sp.]